MDVIRRRKLQLGRKHRVVSVSVHDVSVVLCSPCSSVMALCRMSEASVLEQSGLEQSHGPCRRGRCPEQVAHRVLLGALLSLISTDSAQILFRRPHPVQLQSLEKTTRLVQVLLTQEGHSDEEAESQRVDSSPTVAQRRGGKWWRRPTCSVTSAPPLHPPASPVKFVCGMSVPAGCRAISCVYAAFDGEEGPVSIRFTGPLPCARQPSWLRRPEVTVLRRHLFLSPGGDQRSHGSGLDGQGWREGEGVDFKIKTVELRGKKIRLQIWDTAGQERFNSITSAYYRSAKGIILVYDITKKETFDDLPKWMKMIDKYASEDAELLLVGNKLDCETDREISRQQGEKFAQQIAGMRFCEASAKDNFNVDEIFLKLVDDILKKMPLDMLRNELSNSILSLQPEPEIPPELPPPRPHVRCC
nr:PREDICTED: ras-related protein Rab-12 [Bos mutus]